MQAANIRQRVLVTGHHGYVGSVVARILAEQGFDVVGLDTFLYRGCDLYTQPGPSTEIAADVRDLTQDDLRGYDAVVHLAALSNDPLGELDPAVTYAINRDASIRLAEGARTVGVRRFVFAASCSMYGAADSALELDESAPFAPLTAYAVSKVEAEEAILRLATPSFVPVSLRYATVYGPSPRLRLDVVVNNLVGWATTTGKVRLLSDGSSWRPLIHVEDVARAVAGSLLVSEDLVRGVPLNVGSSRGNYRIREVAETVATVVGGTSVDFAEGAGTDPRSYRVDFSRFASVMPDHQPIHDVADGVRQLVEAYRDADLTIEGFESDRFTRLRRLEHLVHEGRIGEDLRWVEGGN